MFADEIHFVAPGGELAFHVGREFVVVVVQVQRGAAADLVITDRADDALQARVVVGFESRPVAGKLPGLGIVARLRVEGIGVFPLAGVVAVRLRDVVMGLRGPLRCRGLARWFCRDPGYRVPRIAEEEITDGAEGDLYPLGFPSRRIILSPLRPLRAAALEARYWSAAICSVSGWDFTEPAALWTLWAGRVGGDRFAQVV